MAELAVPVLCPFPDDADDDDDLSLEEAIDRIAHEPGFLDGVDDMGSDYLDLHSPQDNDHDGFFPRLSNPQAVGDRSGSAHHVAAPVFCPFPDVDDDALSFEEALHRIAHDPGFLDGADDMSFDYLDIRGPQYNDHDGFFPRGSAPQVVGDRSGSSHHSSLRIVQLESDSDPVLLPSDLEMMDAVPTEEGNEPEWEEVDGFVSMAIEGGEGEGEGEGGSSSELSSRILRIEELNDSEEALHNVIATQLLRDVEWEILSVRTNHGGTPVDADMPTSEYEVLFEQSVDIVGPPRSSPPAAESVVKSLLSVFVTQEDVANGDAFCAVCKDEISLKEKVRRLPCSHRFHGGCILPWLVIRNSCPVCRYELPTDDPEYENWRARRASRVGTATEEPCG